jgi:tripartite-type tricarboxylate transporter receptor subunit TctC
MDLLAFGIEEQHFIKLRRRIKMAFFYFHQEKGFPRVFSGVFILILFVLFVWASPEVRAKEYPTKPITIIVPWPPGPSTDLTPRILAPKLSQRWGVPVSVVNKPGGAGTIGALEVLKAAPDGYTVMSDCPGTSSIQYAWSEKLPYKIEERTYMVRAILTPGVLAVRGDAPWKTIGDMAKEVKTNPTHFRWSSIGGTGFPDVLLAQHRAAFIAQGIDLSKTKMVAYKGTGEVMIALAGGHVDMAYAAPASVNPLMSAGKVRAIAVAADERYKGWPDISTTTEQGYPSIKLTFWVGFSCPPGIPQNIVQTWIDAVRALVADPEVITKLDKIGVVPAFLGGNDFKNFVFEEGKSIKALKVK